MRMCVVCRRRRPKAELLRHVRALAADPGQELQADPDQRLPGRGWYVCPETDCLTALAKRGARRRFRRE